MGDRDDDVTRRLRLVLTLRGDHPLDPDVADRLHADREHQAVGIDDLDLLTGPGPKGARKVSRVAAFDHDPLAVAATEKRRHYITLKAS